MIRRSRFLVSYWEDQRLRIVDYATGKDCVAPPLAWDVLDRLDSWASIEDVVKSFPRSQRTDVLKTIETLVEDSIIERRGRPPPPGRAAMGLWHRWNPVAGFFHQATRDVEYGNPPDTDGRFRLKLPRPATLKSYVHAPRVDLPSFAREGPLADVLLERRTWRRFGSRPVPLGDISDLMGLTFAVQHWLELEEGPVARKTSPSGGARHSLEAYLLAWDVDDLADGTYHYCPDTHGLADLERPFSIEKVPDLLPTQEWFHRPAAIVLISCVFERVRWRYNYPRVYRAVLLEAGHFSQTFCLIATSLGLAPFCTAAFSDSLADGHLGLDGTTESVMFIVGVGTRPETETDRDPAFASPVDVELRPPGWARR